MKVKREKYTPDDVGPSPLDWGTPILSEISTLITNGFVGTATPFYSDESGVPYLYGTNVRANKLELENVRFVTHEFHQEQSKTALQVGDLLMVQSGHIGETAVVTPEANGANCHALIVIRLQKDKVVPEFLCQYINSEIGQARLKGLKVGSSIAHINTKDLKKFVVPHPSFKEQTKIAQILSTWDKAIATTERLLANSRQQKHALMQQLLMGQKRFYDSSETWHQVTLDEVFEKICNGVTYDANATTGLPVSRIETISTGKINFSKVGWAPDNENTKRFQLKKGDILYSHINSLEHIGRVALFNSEKPLFHGMNLLLLRPNKKIIPEFIFYILSSKIGKKYARNYAKSAVNQASISTTDIKSFAVSIPPLHEQQKIAQVLSTADAEIGNLQAQLDKLKLEKKALMQQLLTGKRRVRLDDEEEGVAPIRRVG